MCGRVPTDTVGSRFVLRQGRNGRHEGGSSGRMETVSWGNGDGSCGRGCFAGAPRFMEAGWAVSRRFRGGAVGVLFRVATDCRDRLAAVLDPACPALGALVVVRDGRRFERRVGRGVGELAERLAGSRFSCVVRCRRRGCVGVLVDGGKRSGGVSLNLRVIEAAPVDEEFLALARAITDDRLSGLMPERIAELCARRQLSRDGFCDAFAHFVANDFAHGNLSYGDADRVMNCLISLQDYELPAFARQIYEAFDAGEFRHSGDPEDAIPWQLHTLPLVMEALAERRADETGA